MEMSFDAFAPMAVKDNGGIDIPFGDPRRVHMGFAIPASWSVTLMPRVAQEKQRFACSWH